MLICSAFLYIAAAGPGLWSVEAATNPAPGARQATPSA